MAQFFQVKDKDIEFDVTQFLLSSLVVALAFTIAVFFITLDKYLSSLLFIAFALFIYLFYVRGVIRDVLPMNDFNIKRLIWRLQIITTLIFSSSLALDFFVYIYFNLSPILLFILELVYIAILFRSMFLLKTFIFDSKVK